MPQVVIGISLFIWARTKLRLAHSLRFYSYVYPVVLLHWFRYCLYAVGHCMYHRSPKSNAVIWREQGQWVKKRQLGSLHGPKLDFLAPNQVMGVRSIRVCHSRPRHQVPLSVHRLRMTACHWNTSHVIGSSMIWDAMALMWRHWNVNHIKSQPLKKTYTLHWHHNDHDGVSNQQPHGCLLNRLFRRRSKKTSNLRDTGLCVRNSPGPVNSPHKGPVTRKMFPFDDVIMI